MAAAWQSAPFQALAARSGDGLDSVGGILAAGIWSARSSPTSLRGPCPSAAEGAGTKAAMALAAGSTLAGNLFILGAASNVIIIQNAEKQGKR